MTETFEVDLIVGKSEQLSSQIVGTDCLLMKRDYSSEDWLFVLEAI